MDRYIGIDVHSESCTFAIMSAAGRRLREARVETNGQALREFVRGIAGRKHICIEEGTHAEWLYELLDPLAHEMVVVLPDKSSGCKNDSVDAWKRADELRRGTIKRAVYKAPDRFTALRAATKAYVMTQRDMVRTKCRLNSLYRSRGVQKVTSAIYNPKQRAAWLDRLPAAHRAQAELLSNQLDGLIETHEHAHRWLLEESKKVPIVRLIESAPGIGEIRAAMIVATVISPHRFRTRRQFWSYCGLAIVTRSSSDWTKDRDGGWVRRAVPQTRGLNRNRQPLLKNVFKGAADTITRCMPKHPLALAYQERIAAGTKPNLAQITIARRVAGAVLAMWKHKEKYDPTKQQRQ
jgi:transposase